jgi:RNase P/RNase MRP subunit p29
MSRQFDKLEEALDLPDLDSVVQPSQEDIAIALQTAQNLEKQFDKMDGYDLHDVEMDELAGLAIQAHKDLQELGMNVEVKHAGEIFGSSSQMLKIAVDAKNNKVEKKLKLLRLQLEKMRLDRLAAPDNTITGTAVTMDRNEILKQLRQMSGEDK